MLIQQPISGIQASLVPLRRSRNKYIDIGAPNHNARQQPISGIKNSPFSTKHNKQCTDAAVPHALPARRVTRARVPTSILLKLALPETKIHGTRNITKERCHAMTRTPILSVRYGRKEKTNREMERLRDQEARIVEMDVESYGEQPLSVFACLWSSMIGSEELLPCSIAVQCWASTLRILVGCRVRWSRGAYHGMQRHLATLLCFGLP